MSELRPRRREKSQTSIWHAECSGSRPVGHPLRWYLPQTVYEVTTRTVQERYLLRPGEVERDIVLGVIGRGLMIYAEVMLHAFVYLSNHMHMLLSSKDPSQLAPFIGFVNGFVARRIGRHHGWDGPFWAKRARVIPVLDDESTEGRLRYILAHGVKEGLVATPEAWPGASSTPALVGETLRGHWPLRRASSPATRSRGSRDVGAYDVPITPLPAWSRLSPAERIERARALCASIAEDYKTHRDAPVVGVAKVLAMSPADRPAEPARRPAPRCHASTPELRTAFRRAYGAFTEAYRVAAAMALENDFIKYRGGFPPGSFEGGRKLVPSTTCVAPWLEPSFSSTDSHRAATVPVSQHDVEASRHVAVRTTRAARSTAPPRSPPPPTRTRSPPASSGGADGAHSPPRRRKRTRARDRDQVSSA